MSHWHRDAAVGPSPSFSNLRFSKQGSDVQRSIDGRIATLNDAIVASEARIADICKRREIDADEFTKDNDVSNVGAKSAAYTESLGANLQAKSAIDKLMADMNTLRSESWGIIGSRQSITTLVRVKKNIEAERKFDLSFDELESLGF